MEGGLHIIAQSINSLAHQQVCLLHNIIEDYNLKVRTRMELCEAGANPQLLVAYDKVIKDIELERCIA